jgi:hypothetical protein
LAEVKPTFEVKPFDLFTREPLPDPQWLIEPLFEKDSQVVLWGESGCGKSFVALSWAMAIATGTPWLGRWPVKKEKVLYCVGEGERGMQRRGRAGSIEYGFESIPDLEFLGMAPRLRDPKVLDAFMKLVKAKQPGLVIIDTLARSMTGDENSAEHMSDWLNAATLIQRETGACVLVVHHTAKNVKKGSTPTERGSGALRGAMDTSIMVRGGEHISLTCVKQKDEAQFEGIALMLKQVELRPALVDVDGTVLRKALTSAVIVPFEETIPTSFALTGSPADMALETLTRPMTREDWRVVTKVDGKDVAASTFYRWVKKLEAEGLVELDVDTNKWHNTSVKKR